MSETPGDRASSSGRAVLVVAAGLLVAVGAALAGLTVTGAADPTLLFDPGVVVRWGLPLVTLVGRFAAAVTVGTLVLTAVALPVSASSVGKPRVFAPAMPVVAVAAGVWTLASLLQTIFAYAQISGTLLDDPTFGGQLGSFVIQMEAGRGLLVTTVLAAVIATVAAGASTVGTAGFLTLLAMTALGPPALAGHAAGLGNHETAVTAMWLHLFGVCVWAGGLAGLVLLRPWLGDRLAPAVRVYSSLAVWAFAAVAVSGVLTAWTRVPTLSDLNTIYGMLVVLKVVAFGLLGLAGYLHRRRSLPDLDAGVRGTFARLATVEIVVMGVALGVAGAMAASAPPIEANPRLPTLAETMTGYVMPPPISWGRMLTQWQPDLMWLVLAVLGLVLYLAGVRRLRRRGEYWGNGRTIVWCVGIAILIYVTCGPPMTYGRVLFSAHMGAHMTLSMLTPIFIVLGAPFTLALAALTPREDGSRGPREWLVAVLESPTVRLLTFPPVAAFLFAGSLVFFYFSPMFELALTTHVGHELMHVHFLGSGFLFAWVLIGIDPGPRRVSHMLRLITLLAAMVFHSFFGVSILSSKTILAADFFGGLGRDWGPSLVYDQHFGAGIAWGIGDVPAMLMAVIIAVQWSRSDDREARRSDEQADLDGDAELTAYNEMLARLSGKGAGEAGGPGAS